MTAVAATERGNPQPSDFVVFLGAAVGPDEQPSRALRARTELEIDLYKKG
jgi:hypothetical protein